MSERIGMDIGIVGCGSIGYTLVDAMERMEEVERVYITDKSKDRTTRMVKTYSKVVFAESFEAMLDHVDLVIESASQEAVETLGPRVLEAGKDLLVMSVGALSDEALRERLFALASENRCKLFIPSGAVCGTDALQSAACAEVHEVLLITTKPPRAFRGVPYLVEKGIDLEDISGPTVIFEGSAREAVKHFPKNINVAATVSLSGIGFDRTRVRLVAAPGLRRNRHELAVKGRFGEFSTLIDNEPFMQNPKTSYIAALSAIAAVKKIVSGIWVGI